MEKLKNVKYLYKDQTIKDKGEGLFNMEFVSCIEPLNQMVQDLYKYDYTWIFMIVVVEIIQKQI